MAAKKIIYQLEDEGNFDQIKTEILKLVTGQENFGKGEFDYVAMLKRVTIILIATYGIIKLQPLRSLAFSILGTMVTKWLAERAGEMAAAQA